MICIFVNRDFYSMQPLISAVTLKKEKASVALQEAVPRMLQAASLGLPCREMCDAITHTCGCDKPTTFGQVTCTPLLPALAPFFFQVPQLFSVSITCRNEIFCISGIAMLLALSSRRSWS